MLILNAQQGPSSPALGLGLSNGQRTNEKMFLFPQRSIAEDNIAGSHTLMKCSILPTLILSTSFIFDSRQSCSHLLSIYISRAERDSNPLFLTLSRVRRATMS